MKKFLVVAITLLFCGMNPHTAEGQTVRQAKARIVKNTKVTKAGQRRRTIRRFRRRRHRRVYRRTLKILPQNTQVVRYRRAKYFPVNGLYYVRNNGQYIGVIPPVGFRMTRIPWALTKITLGNRVYHYSNGIYYENSGQGFEIVEPPIGAQVKSLPEEVEEVEIDGELYYAFDAALYKADDDIYELMGYVDED